MEPSINLLAVLVAGVSSMVIGGLWYGPVFGKVWIKLMGLTPERLAELKAKGMAKAYLLNFIAALVMAYVLAHFSNVWGASGIGGAFELAFWIWLGFQATVMLGPVLWAGESPKLYALNVVYQLVTLFVIAIILVSWQ